MLALGIAAHPAAPMTRWASLQPCRRPAVPLQRAPPGCLARAATPQQSSAQPSHAAHPTALAAPAALLRRLASPSVLRAAALCGAAVVLSAALPHAAHAAADAAAGGSLAGLAKSALSWVLHLDKHLGELVVRHGAATYAILFAIVFAETGLVVTPFLPGDSLLFATGALAALGKLHLGALAATYVVAATLGDAVNYAAGNHLGAAALKSRLLKREHIAKTEQFYAKYGGKTVVLARFVPIVRTFAPFVAGVGSMPYRQFGLYNVAGALLWTAVCVGAGFAFGNVPAVHENFSLVVLGIVAVSLLPIAWELWAARREAAAAGAGERAAAAAAARATTPPAAAAAVAATALPRVRSPAVEAAAAEAVQVAKGKVQQSAAFADPLEEQRVAACEADPAAEDCRLYDE